MVEVWVRYGVTEIFTDIDGPVEILQPTRRWSLTEGFVEGLATQLDRDSDTVLIDYVWALDGFEGVVEACLRAVAGIHGGLSGVKVGVSCWRYSDPEVEKALFNYLGKRLREMGVGQVFHAQAASEHSVALLISPAVYWDGRVLGPKVSAEAMGLSDISLAVSPIVGCGGVVANVVYGGLEEVDGLSVREALEASAFRPLKNPEIVLLGGPGHPVDSKLAACVNTLSSMAGVSPGKVAVTALECSGGLGPAHFIELLTGLRSLEGGDPASRSLAAWLETASNHRVCLVTSIPAALVSKYLKARHADTLDQAMMYAWRARSKDAAVLVVPNTVGTRLTGF
jgi:hypothetical protein